MRQLADFYNTAQITASGISGYCPDFEPGAKNDYYYDECKTIEEKIEQINNYAANVYEIKLTSYMAHRIMQFLDTEFTNSHERYHAFHELA